MIDEKGLDEVSADKIGEYVRLSGNIELVDKLLQNEHLNKVPSAVQGLQATRLLLTYCNILGLEKEIIFDLSLARGLDYYTGVIFEAVLKGNLNTISSIYSFALQFSMINDINLDFSRTGKQCSYIARRECNSRIDRRRWPIR